MFEHTHTVNRRNMNIVYYSPKSFLTHEGLCRKGFGSISSKFASLDAPYVHIIASLHSSFICIAKFFVIFHKKRLFIGPYKSSSFNILEINIK
jgi:hypothetical protein